MGEVIHLLKPTPLPADLLLQRLVIKLWRDGLDTQQIANHPDIKLQESAVYNLLARYRDSKYAETRRRLKHGATDRKAIEKVDGEH